MSTYSEFATKVIQYICTKYNKEYTGPLDYKVITCDGQPTLYVLSWGLNQWMFPFVMQGEFANEDDFYNFVVGEIASTRFYETKHFIARRIGHPPIINPDFIDPLLKFDKDHINT